MDKLTKATQDLEKAVTSNLQKLQDDVRARTRMKADIEKSIEELRNTHKVWTDKVTELKSVVTEAIKKDLEPKLKEVETLKKDLEGELARATQGRIDAEGKKKEYSDKVKELDRMTAKAKDSANNLETQRQEAEVIKGKLQKVLDNIRTVIG